MIRVEADRRVSLGVVRDQGRNPTCLSHATTTAHEARRTEPKPMSAEYLHYHANRGDFARGAIPARVTSTLKTQGQPAEQHCPVYVRGVKWDPPAEVVTYKGTCRRLNQIDEVIQAVRDGHHPVLCIETTEEFYEPAAPWIFGARNEVEGHHAVVAAGVGRFGDEPAILIRNSWGKDWADGGHAWLDFGFLRQHLKLAFLVEAN